ncbi:MAG: DUF4382 domain-containing protein [Planctomycetota bacterium]
MRRFLTLLLTFALAACGSGGGGSDAIQTTGQLKLLISDSPIDGADKLWVKFVRIEALREVAGEEQWEVVGRGEREFDLLTLQNDRTAVLADDFLPVGLYKELRLFLAEGSGSPIGGPGFRSPNRIVIDGEEYPLKVPSGEQSGLKLKGEFEIKRDTLTLLRIDFNVRTSVVQRGHRMEFLLKPKLNMFGVQVSGSISGEATDDADDSALAGVTISAQQGGDEVLSARTLSTGAYKLIPLREGNYDLVATKTGYAPAVIRGVTVQREKNTGAQDFALEASESGSISGTAPVGDQYVVLLRWKGYFLAQTTADDDGNFAFADVPVGTYSIELADDGVVVDDIDDIEVVADTDSDGNVLSAP